MLIEQIENFIVFSSNFALMFNIFCQSFTMSDKITVLSRIFSSYFVSYLGVDKLDARVTKQ